MILTGFGRMRLVERIAQRLPEAAPVVELDVSDQAQLDTLVERISPHLGDEPGLDGVLHSIGFAPPATCLARGAFMNAPWEDVATTIQVSAYSFKSLATSLLPLLGPGSSVVGMDFDNRQAWPAYDWMGVAKSTLESVTRYLARDLGPPKGIRVNLCAAGPVKTMAAKSIPPGFAAFEDAWDGRAPLLGRQRPDTRREDRVRHVVRLAARHHRLDGDGGRRVPRDRGLIDAWTSTRCWCSRSVAPRASTRCDRSSRTSCAGATYRPNGSTRSRRTTRRSAGGCPRSTPATAS